MVRQFTPLALAMTLLVAAGANAQDPRGRTTVRTGPFGSVVSMRDDGDRLVLGLSTSSGGMRDTLGLLISSITPGSPAEKAGLEEGNRITAINAVSLKLIPTDASDPEMAGVLGRRFQRELEKMKAGEAVTLRVYANGQNREVKITPVRADELRSGPGSRRARLDDRPTIGASLGGFPSPRDTLGVFIISVAEDGPLAKAGVFEGSRIASINGVDLRVPSADVGDEFMTSSRVRRLTREVEKLEAGGNAELRVYSNGQYRNVTVKTVKRSELKQDGGVSIFHSGGGSGFVMPPMLDMPGFRFDMNHDVDGDARRRIEEAMRGSQIQLRSLMDRLRDDGSLQELQGRLRDSDGSLREMMERLQDNDGSIRELMDKLRDSKESLELQELLRGRPERVRISGDSGLDPSDRAAIEQGVQKFEYTTAPFRSALTTSLDAPTAARFVSTFDTQPFFQQGIQPPATGGHGFRAQGLQGAQGGQATRVRQGPPNGGAAYARSGEPSANGSVFMLEGIRFSPINAQLGSYLGAGSERGLLVLEIDDTWSGLIAGDVLLSVDGRPVVRERNDIAIVIDPSRELPVEILRSGETVKTTLRRR